LSPPRVWAASPRRCHFGHFFECTHSWILGTFVSCYCSHHKICDFHYL
jgi:hypothetical protein